MFNCLGSSLVKDTRSQLLQFGAGQRKVAGEKAAIAAAKHITRSEARDMAEDIGMAKYHGHLWVGEGPRSTRVLRKDFVQAVRAAGKRGQSITDPEAFAANLAILRNSSPTGAGYGMPNMEAAAGLRPTARGPGTGLGATIPGRVSSNYRGIPDTSARYRTWYDRAYGPPPVPGLGLDFGSLLPAGGGAGGLLSMFVKSPEQKAAEKAAKAQEAAAKAQVKAAKIAAQSDADRQASTQRLLLIGGGVVLAAGLGYLLLRKKG